MKSILGVWLKSRKSKIWLNNFRVFLKLTKNKKTKKYSPLFHNLSIHIFNMTKELIDNSGTGSESAPYSTAVLILGIISIPSCFCYGIIGLTVGIIALILSKKGMKMYEKSPSQYKK